MDFVVYSEAGPSIADSLDVPDGEDVLGSGQGMQVPMPQTGSSAKIGGPARIRNLFPETWLWDIVSIGWVVG